MSAIQQKPPAAYVSPTTLTLLTELSDECHHVLKLLAQLELPGLKAPQAEAVLGALSAANAGLRKPIAKGCQKW